MAATEYRGFIDLLFFIFSCSLSLCLLLVLIVSHVCLLSLLISISLSFPVLILMFSKCNFVITGLINSILYILTFLQHSISGILSFMSSLCVYVWDNHFWWVLLTRHSLWPYHLCILLSCIYDAHVDCISHDLNLLLLMQFDRVCATKNCNSEGKKDKDMFPL